MLGLGNILTKGGAVIQKFPNEYSFNFDGANDDLNIGTSSAPTGNFTISCWAYSTGQGTNADNALYYGDGLTTFIAINTTGNYVQTYIGGASGGAKTANSTITQNQWHHIAVTWDGSNTKIYIDGDDKSLTGNGAGNPVSATTYIGGKPSGDTNQFKGYLDEVAIWHTALDATTIGKISSKPVDLTKHSASNLKLWLRCGDKAEPESTTSIARSDFSAELDGSNDYVDLGSATFLTHSNSFTISAWVKKTGQPSSNVDTNDNPTIISQGNVYFTIFVNHDGMLGVFFYNSSNATIYTIKSADGAISLNTWHHVALAWNSTSSQLYVDGVSVYSGSVTPYNLNTGVNGTEPRIGSHASGGQSYWNGVLSSLSVHKTNLPANDIALMAKSRFTPTRDYMLKQVDFDGSNDYIDCGASNSIISGTNITLACWFKSADTDDSKLMQLKRTSSSSNLSLDVNVGGSAGHVGAVVRHSSGGTVVSADGSVDDGAWHHLALTTTSSAQVLYLDGVSIATGTVALVDQFSADPFTIGGQDGSNYNFGGSMVGVAVYSEAKDADFIYSQYAKGLFADWSADTNLSGYWKMGNGTGDAFSTIVDQSSNSNNGTITNGASDDIVQNMVAGYDLGSFRGTEVEDTKNGVIDVSNPTLGVDIIGTWVNNGYNTLTVSTSTISSGVSDGSGNDLATSPFTAVSDKLYKLNINLTLNSGTAPSVFIADDTSGTTSTGSTSQVLTSGENNIYWFGDSGATRYVTIKNASTATNFSLTSSIKQVQGNVGKPTSMDATNFPYTSVLPDQSFLTGENSSYGFGSFDGTNDVVTVSAINENYKSVSFWIKPTNTITTGTSVVRIGTFTGNQYSSIGLGSMSGSLTNELIGIYTPGVSAWENAGSASIPNDSWTHIAFVWDGSKYQIYYNGQPQTTTTNSDGHTALQSNKEIRIGAGGTSTTFFDGDMTGVAFWNKSLEASDILKIYNGTRHLNLLDDYSDNLITYQSFGALDSTTGLADTSSTIYDRSGDGNHGTVSGTTIQSPPNAQPEGYDIESITRTETTP